jgi:hypothetical protein
MFFDKEDGSQDRTRMKIIGRQPKEKYQSVLRQVTYYNNKTSISCPVKRYILVTANDGQYVDIMKAVGSICRILIKHVQNELLDPGMHNSQ